MLAVMKFGGSSVADLGKIRNVAERCIKKWKDGNQVIVVLSAMGKTTDGLSARRSRLRICRPEGRWICCCLQENRYRYPLWP